VQQAQASPRSAATLDPATLVAGLKRRPGAWVDFMMRFELGLEEPEANRARQSAVTIAISYVVGGLVPLAPYMLLSESARALGASVVITLLALALFLGIFWVVSGVIDIFTALSHRGIHDRGWTAALGLLSILAGLIVLAVPGLSLFSLAVILGVWLLIFGVSEITLAFRIRRGVR